MQWTYAGYWNVVLGANRGAGDVVREFGLSDHLSDDYRSLDEWLGMAEVEVWVQSGGAADNLPTEWAHYHQRALQALVEAATTYSDQF